MRTIVLASLVLALALPMTAGALAARAPGTWSIDNALWGLPPAGASGLALKTDTTAPLPLLTNGVYGRAELTLPAGTQIEDLGPLAYDYYYESGSCGGGSPRFQLRIDLDGDFVQDAQVFVYAGPYPNYNGCPQGSWVHEQLDLSQLRFDASQVGGSFYNTQAQAQAAAGPAHQVLKAAFVWDSSWLFGPSVMWWDNLRVNTFVLDEPPGMACVHALPPAGVKVCPGVEVHV